MKKLLFILAMASLGASACQKDTTDKSIPKVSINNPTASLSVPTGKGLSISGTVSDNDLHEMSIVVTQVSDGKELFNATPVVHDLASYDFKETWTPALTENTDVKVVVTATDHALNAGTATILFKVTK
jgi:hypothetical protein